jgi:hypothetical protein
MQEVSGSIPLGSTNLRPLRGLGWRMIIIFAATKPRYPLPLWERKKNHGFGLSVSEDQALDFSGEG